MAVLLVSLRADRPEHVPGEVVTVLSDISKVGTLDRQDMLVLDVAALTVAQAQALYLAPGNGVARARILDVSQVPTQAKNRIAAKCAKCAEKRAEAEGAGRQRFLTFLRNRFGTLTAEEESRTIHEWLRVLAQKWSAAKAAGASDELLGKLDALADRIRKEARDGERSVLDPELALLPNANILSLSPAQLSNATVVQ